MDFSPGQCNDSTHDFCRDVYNNSDQCNEPKNHPVYQCAGINENKCIFYKRCKPIFKVNEKDESWAYSKTMRLQNAKQYKLGNSFFDCWEMCKLHNCTFYSWNAKKKNCLISRNETKICLTSNETDPVIQAKYCCKEKLTTGHECKNRNMTILIFDKDPSKFLLV